MSARPQIPEAEQQRIIALYEAGGTIRSVSEQTFWSQTSVHRVLVRHGIPRRPRHAVCGRKRLSVDSELERTRLYGQGLSIAQVAEVVGVGATAVAFTLARAGVPRRSTSQALRIAYARGRRDPRPPPRRGEGGGLERARTSTG